MGFFSFVLSAFKFRKKETTQEKLQHIDEELERLEVSLQRNQQRQKTTVLYLIIISVLIYSSSTFIFYLWYFPTCWSERLLYSIPFLLFPFIVFGLKRLLHWVFVNRITLNTNAVKELKKTKKKILENVMDTETYKVAKELLKKYDPHRSLVEENESTLKESPKASISEGTELRRRNMPSVSSDSSAGRPQPRTVSHTATNRYPVAPIIQSPPAIGNGSPVGIRAPFPMARGAPPRLPAPVLPQSRTVFDKVCDFIIGDGPTNRFALICKQCYGHNGMALVEEFKFTSYRCCYCGFFNPARKKRLHAPKLANGRRREMSNASDSANSTDVESSSKVDDSEEKEKLFEGDIIENESTEETKSVVETKSHVEEQTDNDIVSSAQTTETKEDDSHSEIDPKGEET